MASRLLQRSARSELRPWMLKQVQHDEIGSVSFPPHFSLLAPSGRYDSNRPIAAPRTMAQFDPMILGRILLFLLVVVFSGCSDPDGEAAPKVIANERIRPASTDPGYGNPQQISASFRFEFEESSIELCSSPATPRAPACLHDSQRCWLEFDDNANKDMDAITQRQFIAEEGTYWIEGVGRMATSKGGFGHSNAYECQVEMKKVNRFIKISS